MALVGNGVRLASTSPCRTASGVGSIYAANVSGKITSGSRRCWYDSEATGTGAEKSAIPDGYRAPGAWVLAPKPGGMAARNTLVGVGSLSAEGAGGLAAAADLTGAGSLAAAIRGLGICLAALAGSGALAADARGLGHMGAAADGVGALAAAVLAVSSGIAALTGSGTLTADGFGAAAISAGLDGAGTLVADAAGVARITAALTGLGALTGAPLGAAQATAAIGGSGSLVAAITALGHMVADLTGDGTVTASTGGTPGFMSAELGGSGGLTTRSIAEAVWNALVANFTATGTMGEALATAGSGGLPPEFQTILRELYMRAGLDPNVPLELHPDHVRAPPDGSIIDIAATHASGATTHTRQP